jgi:hypothetical protein
MIARDEQHEPHWCSGDCHGQFPRIHRSRPVKVGPEPRFRGHGQVAAWLTAADGGPVWVALVAAHMASATVQLSLADAVGLRDGLTRLIEQGEASTREARGQRE